MSTTRDANYGDVIHVGDLRLVVVENMPFGISCTYFRNGLGPYYTVLPHCQLDKRMYEDERIGSRASWWDTHPDMTGEYRVF